MKTALEAAERLRAFLKDMGKNKLLSKAASNALDEDARYIETTIKILSEGDADTIRSLWREVQHFSQFFGGDYAEGPDQHQLLKLMNEFETALFENIVLMRVKS